jgi:hypothetical protein
MFENAIPKISFPRKVTKAPGKKYQGLEKGG